MYTPLLHIARGRCRVSSVFKHWIASMALVPYNENSVPVLSKIHNASAEFNFANHRLRLAQDWNRLGVAAVVWDAAVVMCMYLELGGADLKGKRVIELGAGTGLVGIVAALLGANVTVTDREPALDLLSSNVESNVPPNLQGAVRVSELTWGEGLERYPAGGYEVVLGADIVYLEESFGALLATLQHLSSGNTLLLLSCRIRYERDRRFLQLLETCFAVHEVHYDSHRDVHIYSAVKITTKNDL